MERQSRSLGKASIVLIFLFLGPPVGGFLVVAYFFARDWIDEILRQGSISGGPDDILSLLKIIPFVAFFSYLYGGIQAFVTGSLTALFADSEGRFGYGTAFFAAAVVGVGAGLLLVFNPYGILNFSPRHDLEWAVQVGAIGVAASLILRFLFRRRFGRAKIEM